MNKELKEKQKELEALNKKIRKCKDSKELVKLAKEKAKLEHDIIFFKLRKAV